MTILQFDFVILATIYVLNFVITLLYKKYKFLTDCNRGKIGFENNSVFTYIRPSSIMPRVPFLIIKNSKNCSLRRVIIIHNILCFIVYGLFFLAFILFNIDNNK